MTEQPRDWDRELADIDKIIARQPAQVPPPAAASGPSPAPTRGGPAPAGRLAVFATWLRVLLGLAVAIGITQWPYPNACGLNLAVYLGAILTVIVAGLWSAISSWERRLGVAHTLSLIVFLWGVILAAREVLPRVGYAKHTRAWTCSVAGPEQGQ
ncbi:MAG TPA: hypothetical protein VH879_09555 [Gemmatimonadales bacterium]|jgi:hypothetical protein